MVIFSCCTNLNANQELCVYVCVYTCERVLLRWNADALILPDVQCACFHCFHCHSLSSFSFSFFLSFFLLSSLFAIHSAAADTFIPLWSKSTVCEWYAQFSIHSISFWFHLLRYFWFGLFISVNSFAMHHSTKVTRLVHTVNAGCLVLDTCMPYAVCSLHTNNIMCVLFAILLFDSVNRLIPTILCIGMWLNVCSEQLRSP